MSENTKSPEESDESKLKALFCKMGSTQEQADRMVPQLIKRAEQLSDEKGVSYLEAMDYLIRLTISARNGESDVKAPF